MFTREMWSKARIGKKDDKRIKIPKSEHKIIKAKYKNGLSQRVLARQYGVSRRLIVFILYPERLKTINYSGHWKKYYNKDKNRIYMRSYRQRLRELEKIV